VINSWSDTVLAWAAFYVLADSEHTDGSPLAVEYIVKVYLTNPDGTAKPLHQLQAELLAEAQQLRAKQQPPITPLGWSGPVDLGTP
jgi:hypothetical protein